MKPLVEKDGVKVVRATQVNIGQVHGNVYFGCDDTASGNRVQSSKAGPRWLENTCEAIGVAADGCAATVRLLAIWVVLGLGRAMMLTINLLGLTLAAAARAYLLGWASVGGTHRQLSRRISPWLAPGKVDSDNLPALTAKVLERPAHIPEPSRVVDLDDRARTWAPMQRRLRP